MHYYYCFGNTEYFNDHTGWNCQKRWLTLLKRRHDKIVYMHDQAKREIDWDAEGSESRLAHIELGKEKKIKL